MSDTSLCSVLIAFSCVGLFLAGLAYKRKSDSGVSVWFRLMCISSSLWCICNALFFVLSNEQAALFFHELRFVFVSLSCVYMYLFCFAVITRRNMSVRGVCFLHLIPLATLLIISTNPYHHLMHTRQFIVTDAKSGVRAVDYGFGMWYILHSLYSYSLMLLAAAQVFRRMFGASKRHSAAFGMLLAGILLSLASTLAAVLSLGSLPLDPSPIFAQVSLFFFYVGFCDSGTFNTLFTSREAIFNNTKNVIFILDPNGSIVDYNFSAEKVAREIGIHEIDNMRFSDLWEKWRSQSGAREFQDDPSIFTISQDDREVHFQSAETELLTESGKVIGSYIEVKNITPMMTLIHKLQDTAYFDNLTGLPNRHSFDRQIVEMDRPENYPIGLVVGDVNRLKYVNDNYGHMMGDQLLMEVTKALRTASPANMQWFRMGGDEFTGLLAKTSDAEVRRVLAQTTSICAAFGQEEFKGAGIAMAFKLKTSACQDIYELLHEADVEMYKTKFDRRK